MSATVVLVHGAWHGAWCWDRVVPLLHAAGVPWIAVDLPGHGESTAPLGDLYSHSDSLNQRLAEIDGPVVLVGHSYGGAVISEAADDRANVRRLVFVCAIVPDVGEPVGGVMTAELPAGTGASDLGAAMLFHDDGTMTLNAALAVPALLGDCSDDDIEFALARVGPQSAASFGQPLRAAAWHHIPSTYVLCTGDRAVNPEFQRAMATRTTDVVELDTSHSPFLSRPDLVADLLIGFANNER